MTSDQRVKRQGQSGSFARAMLCISGLLAFAGCGGSKTPQPIAPQPKPKPQPIAVANAGAPPPNRPAADGPKSTNPTPQKPIDPQANPNDVFRILPPSNSPYDPNDVFAVVKSAPDPNTVAAILPQEHGAGDFFRIIKRGEPPVSPHKPHPKLKMPRGFELVSEAGYNESGLPWRIRSRVDGSVMALVPHGVAQIGSDHGPPNTKPQLTIELKPFYMDVTEVTLGQYEKFLQATKNDRRVRVRIQSVDESLPKDTPMTGLPWGDAVAYLKWAGKTLPTEAQWEKAARGEQGFPHPWGRDDAIWFQKRTRDQITPVGHYSTDKSPYGVFDLAGNAREWCADWYRPNAFTEVKAKEKTLADWEGPKSAEPEFTRVVKGNGPDWNLWHRAGVGMRIEDSSIGFRGVLTVTNFPLDKTTTQTTSVNR